jgi:hypothetical protein
VEGGKLIGLIQNITIIIIQHKMRGMMRLVQGFSKKLGIADTAKVIQDKIMNITQVVVIFLPRTTSNSSAL